MPVRWMLQLVLCGGPPAGATQGQGRSLRMVMVMVSQDSSWHVLIIIESGSIDCRPIAFAVRLAVRCHQRPTDHGNHAVRLARYSSRHGIFVQPIYKIQRATGLGCDTE